MTWIVRIHTIPEDKKEALIQYCQLAQSQDPSFKFAFRGNQIIIDCPDDDVVNGRTRAFKRGVLLHHRFGVFFEVEFEHRPFGYKIEEGER